MLSVNHVVQDTCKSPLMWVERVCTLLAPQGNWYDAGHLPGGAQHAPACP